ncbi:MAG: hypothetical protein K2R98_01305 [Gemmataceae bacterium]|nr:hypothetical protein [Gemmataceae bacterium]
MRARAKLLVVACLILCVRPVQGADLTKIERTVAKGPQYQGKPKYCLLVFGPEAKFRVWLILDGTVLYVDRNGNGDLTEPDKRVAARYKRDDQRFGFRPGQLAAPDGTMKYNLSLLRMNADGCDMEIECKPGYARAGFDGPGKLRFADRAKDAPIIHFFGPLTLTRFEPQAGSVSQCLKPQPLVRGEPSDLAFSLGTPGLGSGTFAKYPHDPELSASVEIRFANGKTHTAVLKPDG